MSYLIRLTGRALASVAAGYMAIDLMLADLNITSQALQAVGTLYLTICLFGVLTLSAEGRR